MGIHLINDAKYLMVFYYFTVYFIVIIIVIVVVLIIRACTLVQHSDHKDM